MIKQFVRLLIICLLVNCIYHELYSQLTVSEQTKLIIDTSTYFVSENDLSIDEGGELQVMGFLSVDGSMTNQEGIDGLRINSNNLHSGSIIFNNGNPPATVERYISNGKWSLISSPVSNADANQLFFNHDPEVWLKEYNESSNGWSYLSDLETELLVGKGFAYWISAARQDTTVEYQNNLRSDDLVLNSSSTPSINYTGSDYGYNLIGNPFSSSLDWDDDSWVYNDIEETVWVWEDGGNGDGSGIYLYRNKNNMGNLTDGVIPYGQGFFIRTTDTDASITIPAAARTHSAQPFYQSSSINTEIPILIINVSDESNKDQVWIAFLDGATELFDNGWDVSKFFTNDNVPQIYLNESADKLSIDVLPVLTNETRSVELCFLPGKIGNYELSAAELSNLSNVELILEDKKVGVFHDLKMENIFSFQSNPGDNPNRFILHFNTDLSSNNIEYVKKQIKIFGVEKTIFIKNEEYLYQNERVNVEIYDLTGRQVLSVEIDDSPMIAIPVNYNYQYLIVKYQSKQTCVVKKVFIE